MNLPEGPFACIAADPPWIYTHSTRKTEVPGTGWHGPGERHYPTMALNDIKNMPVASVTASDCICFVWTTNVMLRQGFDVLAAWGFDYRGMITWAKTDRAGRPFFGMGYWVRGATEHMIFGVRGKVKPLSKREVSYFTAPVREHSRKPDEAYSLIERLVPGPRLELFARRPREGWAVWGNEVTPE